MRDRLERIPGADVELVKGSGGVFEISRDGRLEYSKKSTGRFPTPDEIEALTRS